MSAGPVNDVSICVATENGSGSASANSILFKSIFKLGIPCSAKNIFPSNIQGLPTWYQIRVNGEGYLARKDVVDVMVAFNDATAAEDVDKVRPGGLLVYDSSHPLPACLEREGLSYVGVPAWQLVRDHVKATQLRAKLRNMVYVGGLAALFGIPLDVLRQVLADVFGDKPDVIEPNLLCIRLGYEHIGESGASQDISRLEPVPGGNDGKIMAEGNAVTALGAIFGGMTVLSWYPITPSSSIAEELSARIPAYRTDEEGKRRYAVVQAEDELAAAAMVIGAGFCGARAMTSTSGPGLSLMQESIGLAYFAEVPCVFTIVQRGGPSTGLPTRTQQSDITLMHQASHGDTRHIVLIPHDNPSMFEMAWRSFDLADRFQTPVFVMSDLDLGMNMSVSGPLAMPDAPMDRGKVLDAEALETLEGRFRRYAANNGDGVAPRTLPGTDHPGAAYFARGSGHNEDAVYSEDSTVYRKLLDRLRRKYEAARNAVPRPIVFNGTGSREGLISFGSTFEAAREAVDRLAQAGRPMDHLLLRALPLTEEVERFLAGHDVVYLAEQNRDGQMAQILRDDFPQYADRVHPVLVYDGLSVTAGELTQLMEGGTR